MNCNKNIRTKHLTTTKIGQKKSKEEIDKKMQQKYNVEV